MIGLGFGNFQSGGASFTGLLDLYPSAAAAYSVRRLSGVYSGSLMEVRRSSDNALQDIGFDANGDLDTASLLSFVGAGDGFVSTWYDQSGNANNAQNTTASEQPRIINSGTLEVLNGIPALYSSATVNLAFSNVVLTQDPYFISQVVQHNGTNKIFIGDLTTTIDFIQNRPSQYRVRANNVSVDFTNILSSSVQYNSNIIRTSGGDLIHSRNGSTETQTAQAQDFTINGVFDGYSTIDLSLVGYGQELVIWQQDYEANRAAIESNINTYFSIYP
jgi:hypothetical protein